MKQNYRKDDAVKFSNLEIGIIKSISKKDGSNILPEEKEYIFQKYESIFGCIDLGSNKPVYKQISDLMIQPAWKNGIHIPEINPFRSKLTALEYAMNSPNKISEEELQKKARSNDGSNYVFMRIYKPAA